MTDKNDELHPETMSGDIRDIMLNYIRNFPKSWAELGEADQRAAAQNIDQFARNLMARVVSIAKAEGAESCHGQLLNFNTKGDKVKATIEIPASDGNLLMLNHCRSGDVRIVSADTSRHEGERQSVEAHVTRDQPDMLGQEQPAVEQNPEPETGPDDPGVEDDMPEGDEVLKTDRRPLLYDLATPQLKMYEKHPQAYWDGVQAYEDWDPNSDKPANPHDARTNRGKLWVLGWNHSEHAFKEGEEAAPEDAKGGWQGEHAEAGEPEQQADDGVNPPTPAPPAQSLDDELAGL